jgi:hypothetical protein
MDTIKYTGTYPLERLGFEWEYVVRISNCAAFRHLTDTLPKGMRIPVLDTEYPNKAYVIISHTEGMLNHKGKVTAVYNHDGYYYLIAKQIGKLTEEECIWMDWLIDQFAIEGR